MNLRHQKIPPCGWSSIIIYGLATLDEHLLWFLICVMIRDVLNTFSYSAEYDIHIFAYMNISGTLKQRFCQSYGYRDVWNFCHVYLKEV